MKNVTLILGVALLLGLSWGAQAALVLRLEADNYDASTGTWSDTSGLGNNAAQATAASRPSLVASRTVNGSSAVRFDGANDWFSLPALSTTSANGFTVLAYTRPQNGRTLASGGLGSFQYRIAGGNQQVVEANQANRGASTTVLSMTDFSNINAQGNTAGGGFRLNGAADGVVTAQANPPYEAINAIGRKTVGSTEQFSGDITEIRVYDEQLSLAAIQTIEAEFAAAYEAPTGRVVLPVIANPTFDTDAELFTTNNGLVGSGNPAEIPDWPGTGLRGINPGNGAGAAFRNNGNNASQVGIVRNNASISTTIPGFEVGKEYRLAFDYNSRSGYSVPGMTATIGGASLSDPSVEAVGGSNAYYAGNIVFTAANPTETLTVSEPVAGDRTLLVDNFRVFRNGPAIADNGFENPVQPDNAWKQASGAGSGNLTGSAWTITGSAGITRNISAFQNGNRRAPEGDQHALIQATGAFAQAVSGFELGADYSLSLLTMARQTGAGGNDLEAILDFGLPSEIVLLDIPEITFSSFTELESLPFLAEKDAYELTIRSTLDGGELTGDRTTFFDNVWFNQLTEAPVASDSVIPEPSTAALLGLAMLCLAGCVRRRRGER